MRTQRRLLHLWLAVGIMTAILACVPIQAQQTPTLYTVNGEVAPVELQQMLFLAGLQPGDYYIDNVGDFGKVGEAPVMNILGNGGPPLGTGTARPTQQMPTGLGLGQSQGQGIGSSGWGETAAGDAIAGLAGSRIFWVYSPSVFSSATGGSSGYIHLCPGNVFYRSSEGSFSVGGDYNAQYGANESWAGGAHVARDAGRWSVRGADLVLQNPDGGTQTFSVSSVNQGRWQIGRTKYAVERGRASCR